MLGLPKQTECNKQLPKKAIYAKFNLDNAAREKFDADISRITIVNEISPSTTSLAAGSEIQSFYVLQVSLKQKDYDKAIISQLPKLINQKMLLLLECGGDCQLAVHYGKLICSPWKPLADCSIALNGLDLDAVWENVIVQIGNIRIAEGNTLGQQIELDTQRAKLEKEIARLEKLARKEVQPRKKLELVKRIKEHKLALENRNGA